MQTNQSTLANYKSSDFQACKTTGASPTFAMAHKMGLYQLSGGSKSIVTTKYYISGYSTYYWTHNSTAINAKSSSSYTSSAKMFLSNNIHYYIARAGVATDYAASNEYPNSDGTNAWSKTAVIVNGGQYKSESLSAPTLTCQTWSAYTIAKGDVFYTDGALAHSNSQYSTTSTRSPAGIVMFIPSNNAEKAYAESGYGAGHALIMSLKNVSSTKIWSKNSGHVTGLTACTTLAAVKADASGMKNCSYMNSTNYPAAYAALHYSVSVPTAVPNKTTGWFLPSMGQWMKVAVYMGDCTEAQLSYNDSNDTVYPLTKTNKALTVVGSGKYNSIFYGDSSYGVDPNNYLWTSTEYNDYTVNRPLLNTNRTKWDSGDDDGQTQKTGYQGVVRPFLAL